MNEPNNTALKPPSKPPNCIKCAHFRITWDTMFPRACDLFSI